MDITHFNKIKQYQLQTAEVLQKIKTVHVAVEVEIASEGGGYGSKEVRRAGVVARVEVALCPDDGTPRVSNEVALIHFSRNATSFQEAIVTAKADVERAGFEVARVEIGASEITVLET